MDLTMKQWIVGAILIVIVVILIDGIRRMRNARRDSLHMSLDVKRGASLDLDDENYGSEFPNGGARVSQKTIDKERISKIKSQYDFGREISIKPRNNKSDDTGNSTISNDTQSSDKPQQPTSPFQAIDEQSGSQVSQQAIDDNHLESSPSQSVNTEQWVDSDESDAEYYAEQWDDQTPEATSNSAALDDSDWLDDRADRVVMGDGQLDDASESPALAAPPIDNTPSETMVAASDNTIVRETGDHVAPKKDNNAGQSSNYQPPEQVPLNLEESVPVLMESVDDNDDEHDGLDKGASDDSEDNYIQEDSQEDTQEKTVIDTPAANIRSVGRRVNTSASNHAAQDNDEAVEVNEESLETHSANKPRYESKYFSKQAAPSVAEKTPSIEEVLVVNVKAPKGHVFQGEALLQLMLDNGLRYGAMSIFHRHTSDDGEGPVLFSLANMLKPGTFDLQNIDSFATAGVTLFLTLPVYDDNNMAAFDKMIETAKHIAEHLGGELNDEHRSIMTGQTIEHYRERIRDFARRQQLEKKR